MKQERQIEFIKHVFEGLEKQQNKTDADGVTHQIPASKYTDPDQLVREKATIFSQYPVVVGATAQLKAPGDYFLNDLLDVPLLIIKGQDGKVRAFLNMCRHRGVRLLEESEGHLKRMIVCPYHAWSYDNQGCLKGVFHPQGFEGVDAATHSLIEQDCWERLGLIFVVPDPDSKGLHNIDQWLQEAYNICEGFDFGAMIPYHHRSGTLDCNWKLLVDGGLEGYHFKIAHSNTIGPYFLDNLSVPTSNQLHSAIIFPKKAMKKLMDEPEATWKYRKVSNTLLHLFPNTVILIEPDHLMVVSFYPIDEKTTQYKSFMLLPSEPATQKETDYWDLNGNIFWNAINEDNEMAVLQQQSFNRYAKTSMTVGSYEKLLVQFENLVDQALEGKL